MKPVPITGLGAMLTSARHAAKLAMKPGDCGVDLFPCMDHEDDIIITRLGFSHIWAIPTQIRLSIPAGHFGWVTPRSSSFEKLLGCTVIPGIIDHGYTGEYHIRVSVPAHSPMNGYNGAHVIMELRSKIWSCSEDRVALAQLIIVPFTLASLEVVTDLAPSLRGSAGYGSTDHLPWRETQAGVTQKDPAATTESKIDLRTPHDYAKNPPTQATGS